MKRWLVVLERRNGAVSLLIMSADHPGFESGLSRSRSTATRMASF